MLYTFGKIVEEEEGAAAVWLTYIVCALGDWFPCTRLPSVQHFNCLSMDAHPRCLAEAGGEHPSRLEVTPSTCNKLNFLQILRAAMCLAAFAGASVASFFFDQGAVSLGASGAVFGLFAVAVLLKLKFRFQKLVGPFDCQQLSDASVPWA